MPIYEYECEICGSRFEHLARGFGDSRRECPKGHRSVRRLLSPPGIIFRGSGFYTTDHRPKADKEASGEKKEAED